MFVGGIGLAASLIQLITFVGAIQTPETASNFYVNSREFISWTLLTWVYLFCLANAYWRRRQRELFGGSRIDHSITNLLAVFAIIFNKDVWGDKLELEAGRIRLQKFNSDFSIVFIFNFLFVFFFSRAISATEFAVGITNTPWEDLWVTFGRTLLVTIPLMIFTSMFDFVLSIFLGDPG